MIPFSVVCPAPVPRIRIACARTDVVPATIQLWYPPVGIAIYRSAAALATPVLRYPVIGLSRAERIDALPPLFDPLYPTLSPQPPLLDAPVGPGGYQGSHGAGRQACTATNQRHDDFGCHRPVCPSDVRRHSKRLSTCRSRRTVPSRHAYCMGIAWDLASSPSYIL
jgi:hypothetical protein